MALTKSEVEHVAKLARLALTDQEKEHFTGQLDNILGYIEKLKELDTKNVSIASHPYSSKTVWREDQSCRSDLKELILSNSPEREEDFFKVKKVME